MNLVLRWMKVFAVMFPVVMILNQCMYNSRYNNCYRAYCLAAAFGPVSILTLFLSLGVIIVQSMMGHE
jgi:hypothetical protein